MIQRGYRTLNYNREKLWHVYNSPEIPATFGSKISSENKFRQAIEFLTLNEQIQSMVGVWSLGPHRMLHFHDRALVVNFSGFMDFLMKIFVDVDRDNKEKGHQFEISFVRSIKEIAKNVQRNCEIVSHDGDKKEIDCFVKLEDTLIIFELCAIERPLDFEIGRPRTIAQRCARLDKKIEQLESLVEFIDKNRLGRNYDFSEFHIIKSFVVSPFVEWIWSTEPRLWSESKKSRILSGAEAVRFIQSLT